MFACSFDGAQIQSVRLQMSNRPGGGPNYQSYVIPVELLYFASGGNGAYTRDFQQLGTVITIDKNGGTTTTMVTNTDESLENISDVSYRGIFYDAPGIGIASTGHFTITGSWWFGDYASVSSGGQTVECPIVS